MAQETEFVRIKRAVEAEKVKKMQAEAKSESITAERERLLKEANEISGQQFENSEEVSAYVDKLKGEIEGNVREMSKILEEEGVSY